MEALLIEGPERIAGVRLLTMRKMLKLECMGLKRSRQSIYSIVKREHNLKGNKQKVYEDFSRMVTCITGIEEREYGRANSR